jgi:hypothetical protein
MNSTGKRLLPRSLAQCASSVVRADVSDDAAGDPHVRGQRRAAVAVDHRAAPDDQVVSAHFAILAA